MKVWCLLVIAVTGFLDPLLYVLTILLVQNATEALDVLQNKLKQPAVAAAFKTRMAKVCHVLNGIDECLCAHMYLFRFV